MGEPELSDRAGSVLRGEERVEYHARPSYLAFTLPYVIRVLGVVAAVGFVLALVLLPIVVVALPFVIIGWLNTVPIAVWLAKVAAQVVAVVVLPVLVVGFVPYRNAEYVVTDQRIVRLGGVFRRDYEAVDRDDVRSVGVTVGLVDELLGTGTVEITVPFADVSFRAVHSPHEVAESIDAGGGVGRSADRTSGSPAD